MVYKLDFIYKILGGTHVTDGVTDNIVGRRCPGSIPDWVLKKEKKQTTYICIIYLICHIYCVYLIFILYIYIAYICRFKSEWYINWKSFTTYIVEPKCSMVLRKTSSGNKVRGCLGLIPGRVLKIGKKACIIYMYYISYM